jgi:hypothetical protein
MCYKRQTGWPKLPHSFLAGDVSNVLHVSTSSSELFFVPSSSDKGRIYALRDFPDLETYSRLTSMKTSSNTALAVASIAVLAIGSSFGAMVPAGTPLVVRTARTFTSIDAPGTPVPMELANDVVIGKKVILAAGTKIQGEIVTSKRTHRSRPTLTVNITAAQVHGRAVAIKTTGAVDPGNPFARTTRRGVEVSTYSYQIPAGTKLQFRLAQPLDI